MTIQRSYNKGSAQLANDYATTITLLDHLTEAILLVDTKGIIQYANSKTLELLKTDFQSLHGKLIDSIFTNEQSDSDTIDEITEHFFKGNYSNLNTSISVGNSAIPIQVSFNIVKTDNDEIDYIIVSLRDIKSLENEILNHQIMSISKERIKALGELSVSLVHEMSQPLAAIQMRLKLLQDDVLQNDTDEGYDKHFVELEDLFNRINKAIQAVRLFAFQSENNSIGLVNLSQSINNAKRLVDYEMFKRKIKINVNLSDDLPFIIGNPMLIEQIFVNLLVNSREAFESHGNSTKPEIVITSDIVDENWIEIYVTDNGQGIDGKIIDMIFNPFYSTKGTDANPGLGLSIAKEIAKSAGGDILLNQNYSDGAQFVIKLPLNQDNNRNRSDIIIN